MSPTDIITAIYNQLWFLLEQSGTYFNGVVAPQNRVKINFTYIDPTSTLQSPVQYTATENDASFPQCSILFTLFEHSGKAQSRRFGDQHGATAAGRIRILKRSFDIVLIHRGFDVTTNALLEQSVIDTLEAASTGIGLLPIANVRNLEMGEITGRTDYGPWMGGSTLRSKTVFNVPFTITFINPTFPVVGV
jgi:hypothetical protein